MGTDIHLVVEKRQPDGSWRRAEEKRPTTDKWDDHPLTREDWYSERNYTLFGVLAGVRGYDIPKIAEPRGLPDNIDREEDANYDIGDHTYSWLTVQELYDYDWSYGISEELHIDAESYEHWSRVKEWSRGRPKGIDFFANHTEVDELAMQVAISHIEAQLKDASWQQKQKEFRSRLKALSLMTKVTIERNVAEHCPEFYSYVMPRLRKLCEGDLTSVRIVFGFDS